MLVHPSAVGAMRFSAWSGVEVFLHVDPLSLHSSLRSCILVLVDVDQMHLASTVAAASLLAANAHAWSPSPTNGTDKLAQEGLANLEAYHKSLNSSSSCNLGNAAVRREWLTLSGRREDCLHQCREVSDEQALYIW
ncbi:hypothetical protein L1887_59504 [Cichorium endivia]|nr:hypothetical protein L1887_59504 [Cichorium endivia]